MTDEGRGALCKEERAFIHDLATPIAAMNLIVEALLEAAQARLARDEFEISQLETLRQALTRMTALMQERRALLIRRGENP